MQRVQRRGAAALAWFALDDVKDLPEV